MVARGITPNLNLWITPVEQWNVPLEYPLSDTQPKKVTIHLPGIIQLLSGLRVRGTGGVPVERSTVPLESSTDPVDNQGRSN